PGAEVRRALDSVLPALVEDLVAAGSPKRGLANLERFFAVAGSPLTLLSAVGADPALRERLAVLCSQSQYFADVLVREPRLLDWLGTQVQAPSADDLARAVAEALAPLRDETHRLAALHRLKRRELLACG